MTNKPPCSSIGILLVIVLFGYSHSFQKYIDADLAKNSMASGSTVLCPSTCKCSDEGWSTNCQAPVENNFEEFLQYISPMVQILSVSLAEFSTVSTVLQTRSSLKYLSLTKCQLRSIDKDAFQHLPLKELDLSRNLLMTLDKHVYKNLATLTVLDLSFNIIEFLDEEIFSGLKSLKVLKLHDNQIRSVPPRLFMDLISLSFIDVSRNNISRLESQVFAMNLRLEELYMSENKILSISSNLWMNAKNITQIKLENNPWDCSCRHLHWLAKEMQVQPTRFINSEKIVCHSPKELKSLPLSQIHLEECMKPIIYFVSQATNVQYHSDTVLYCNVTGFPAPSIFWKDPWGGVIAHESQRQWLSELSTSEVVYDGPPTFIKTSAIAMSDGSIIINKFRRYLSGQYTCYAVNPVGIVNDTIDINIVSAVLGVYNFSLFVSAGAAGIFLLLGIIIALIKCCHFHIGLRKHKKAFYRTQVLQPMLQKGSKEKSLQSQMDLVCFDSSPTKYGHNQKNQCQWNYDDDDDDDNDDVEHIDEGSDCMPDNITFHLKDTIDEMGVRFRAGMEKRVEKMRTHVKSHMSHLSESSNQYMQNIRDTSQKAVQKMRVGVVMSVGQVKQHVLSMKELCGRGEMCQTVSTFSVATDVDSNETTTVIKNITFV